MELQYAWDGFVAHGLGSTHVARVHRTTLKNRLSLQARLQVWPTPHASCGQVVHVPCGSHSVEQDRICC